MGQLFYTVMPKLRRKRKDHRVVASEMGEASMQPDDAMPPTNEEPVLPVNSPENGQPTSPSYLKAALLIAFVAIAGVAYWQLRDVLTLQYLADRETTLRQFQTDQPWLVAAVAVGAYIAVAGLSLPGAAILTLVCGWYFGFWRGFVVVSFGATAGATVAFLLSRYFLRGWVQQKMATRLKPINEAFEREGAFYLLSLRLIPGVPFFVVNAVMGLTNIKTRTFWWVSQLGMVPGTAAYVYAGAAVPSLRSLADNGIGKIVSWQLLVAFVGLGLLPIVVKRLVGFFKDDGRSRCNGRGNDVSDGDDGGSSR